MDKKKILIVDDEENILIMLESRLTHAGYAVSKATNGREAIDIAKKELPDLIISDIMMPELDGGDMSNILKNDPLTKGIPIIFLTGLLKKEEESARKVVQGRYFMAKPFDADALLKAIDRVLYDKKR